MPTRILESYTSKHHVLFALVTISAGATGSVPKVIDMRNQKNDLRMHQREAAAQQLEKQRKRSNSSVEDPEAARRRSRSANGQTSSGVNDRNIN